MLGKKGRGYDAIAGPFTVMVTHARDTTQGTGTVVAPPKADDSALVLAYAFDDEGGAVCTTIPVKIGE